MRLFFRRFLIPVIVFAVLFLVFRIYNCSGASTGSSSGGEDSGGDAIPAGLLGADNFTYLGVFRLPVASTEVPRSFGWGGSAMTHYYAGDPTSSDSTPGSLIIGGTNNESVGDAERSNFYAEVSIPEPVNSQTLSELNTAAFLQDFVDLRSGSVYADDIRFEVVKAGIQVMPALGSQTSDTIYMAWGQHIEDENAPASCEIDGDANCLPTHSWRALGTDGDLDANATQGPWWVEDSSLYKINSYMFDIPSNWASEYIGGRRLATGRFRDGGQGSQGPVLIAIGPWLDGNPPAANSTIEAVSLIDYSTFPSTTERLNNYQHPDEWAGGAWLNTTSAAAVIFVGSKAAGDHYWYGWQRCPGDYSPCMESENLGGPGCFNAADGSDCGLGDDYYCDCSNDTCDENCYGTRGWWTETWVTEILFYDPDDLAAVAAETSTPSTPQPYTTMSIDDHMLNQLPAGVDEDYGSGTQRRYHIGSVAYDRTNNLLYVAELLADTENEQPLVHVWRIGD